MSCSDLTDKLKAKLAFKEIIPMNEYEEKGRTEENARLAPLHDKMIACVEALEKLSVCGGGCDGPNGCNCKAPIAREVLRKLQE